ncbi:MAG: DUF1152 domain-containing protein [Crenarchaeota archaeon]|nr:DUF1152 domain-containing protein [Thermoproteota archaeon]
MNAFYADSEKLSPCLAVEGAKRALFIGIGGGGDVASATVLASSFARCGGEAIVGSFIWERFSVDPIPGPVRFEELENIDRVSRGLAWVSPATRARRGSRVVKPQAAAAAEIVGRVLALDLWLGPRELARELRSFVESEGIDLVVGVDVGGDSLASGCEEELWSPLADSVGVAMLSYIPRSLLAVVSPGADGELDPSYVENRISMIARAGGFVGGYVLSSRDKEFLERVVEHVHTEASRVPLKALEGCVGEISIRSGSRVVRIGISSCVAYFLDPRIVKESTLAKLISSCSSLEEANDTLHRYGVYTELDLERDLYRFAEEGREIDRDVILEVRERGRSRLGPCRAA